MSGHLNDETLIELVEAAGSGAARAHVAECLHCRSRLEQARAGLELAREARVPEPSPLYWESFRTQVGRRLEGGETSPRWGRLAIGPWLAVAAALLAVLGLLLPGTSAPPASTARVLPAWSPLPPAEEDTALELVAAVLPTTGELGPLAECQGLGECLSELTADLSDEETWALAEALRTELAERDL